MDRGWIQLPNRFSPQYIDGIKEFIKVARDHKDSIDRVICPCRKCQNRDGYFHIDVVEEHLWVVGLDRNYIQWVNHGEDYEVLSDDDYEEDDNESISSSSSNGGQAFSGLQDMINIQNDMVELQSQPTPKGSIPMTEDEICDRVLGTRTGYVKRLGHGVLPSSSSSSTASYVAEAIRRVEEAEKQFQELKAQLQEQSLHIKNLLAWQTTMQAQFASMASFSNAPS